MAELTPRQKILAATLVHFLAETGRLEDFRDWLEKDHERATPHQLQLLQRDLTAIHAQTPRCHTGIPSFLVSGRSES